MRHAPVIASTAAAAGTSASAASSNSKVLLLSASQATGISHSQRLAGTNSSIVNVAIAVGSGAAPANSDWLAGRPSSRPISG